MNTTKRMTLLFSGCFLLGLAMAQSDGSRPESKVNAQACGNCATYCRQFRCFRGLIDGKDWYLENDCWYWINACPGGGWPNGGQAPKKKPPASFIVECFPSATDHGMLIKSWVPYDFRCIPSSDPWDGTYYCGTSCLGGGSGN